MKRCFSCRGFQDTSYDLGPCYVCLILNEEEEE